MLNDITAQHPVFNSTDYQKDIVPFNLIEVIKYNTMILVSDEKHIIISGVSTTMPIWVWTSDSITDDEISNLSEYFYEKFQNVNPLKLVAKPKVAKVLIECFNNHNNVSCHVVHMESFVCKKLIPAKNNTGSIYNPKKNDFADIAQCMKKFEKDCFGKDLSDEESHNKASDFIENPGAFVLKVDDKIASIAKSARETQTHISINNVYTKPEYRGKGFGAAIVAHICKIILDSGKIPTLYTDLSNPCSNKAYKNVGFTECGKVDEVTLKWSDKNG